MDFRINMITLEGMMRKFGHITAPEWINPIHFFLSFKRQRKPPQPQLSPPLLPTPLPLLLPPPPPPTSQYNTRAMVPNIFKYKDPSINLKISWIPTC
jgi:hypothetical protein